MPSYPLVPFQLVGACLSKLGGQHFPFTARNVPLAQAGLVDHSVGTALAAAVFALFLFAVPTNADVAKASYLHYLQGLSYERQGDYIQALKEYDFVVALDPSAAYVFRRQAMLTLELGDTDKALKAAQRSFDVEGPTEEGCRLLGDVHWARGDTEEAKGAFKKALELNPRSTEALLSLANLTSSTDPEEAKGYYRKYIESDPENAAEGYYQLALIEERQGSPNEAAARLRSSIDADPDFMQARYALAQLYEVRQDTPAALTEYREILSRDSRNPALWVRVGEIQSILGDAAGAEAAFRKAKEIQTDHPGACFWLAQLAEERGEYAAAAALIRESAHLAADPKLSLRLSYVLTQAGKLPEAVQVLEAASKKWPKDPEVAYFLSLGYDDMGQTAKAVPVLEEAVRLAPDSRDARFQLGALYEKIGRIEDAAREFKVILSSRPHDAQVLNYLGYSLADRGRELDEAKAYIERAVALEPENGAYRDSLGWVHFKMGRSTESIQELKAALAILPGDETLWEHIGDVYQDLGDKQSAWAAWKNSHLLKPSNRKVELKLKGIEAATAPGEVGTRLLGFLQSSQGSVKNLLGSCTVTGRAGGKTFTFSGLIYFERTGDPGGLSTPFAAGISTAALPGSPAQPGESVSGAVRIELLGPFFLPIWGVYLGPDDVFSMDPLHVEGVPQEAIQGAVSGTLRALREYWSGSLFKGPGRIRQGWSKSWIETPEHLLFLSANNLYLQSTKTRRPGIAASFKNFQIIQGHPLPKVLEVEGPGFGIRIQLDQVGAQFVETPLQLP